MGWRQGGPPRTHREPTAKEKREHSTELYDAFTKSELELQGEKERLKSLALEIESLKVKLGTFTGQPVEQTDQKEDSKSSKFDDANSRRRGCSCSYYAIVLATAAVDEHGGRARFFLTAMTRRKI